MTFRAALAVASLITLRTQSLTGIGLNALHHDADRLIKERRKPAGK